MSNESPSNNRLAVKDDEIDLQRLWALLVDHLWLIGGTTVLALILGVAYTFVATPVYKADALLQVEPKQGGIPGLSDLDSLLQSSDTADTEIQIIRSRMVLDKAADKLNMAISVAPKRLPMIGRFSAPAPAPEGTPVPLFAGYRDSKTYVTVKSFKVPEQDQERPFILRANAQGQPALYLDDQLIAAGPADRPLQSADGSIQLVIGHWQPGGEPLRVIKHSRFTVTQGMLARLSVAEHGKQTGIIGMSYTGMRRDRIKVVLNAIAQAYVAQNIQRNAAQAQNSLDFLNQQLPKIKDRLNQAETKLNQYRSKSDSVDLSMETQAVLQQLVNVDGQINELQIKESQVAARFTKDHPAYQTLIAQRKDLERQKARINEKISKLPKTQQAVLRMMRDVEVNQQIYVSLLNKVQQLRIMKASTVGNVRIIDHALVEPNPIKPKKRLLTILSAFLGLMASMGFVLLRSALHRGIQSPEQLQEQGIAVYAAVPLSEHQQKVDRLAAIMRRRKRIKGGSIPLLALNDPADPAVEALRSLRTSLHFATMEASNKVLMISGPSPEVGKSFISANLGAVLAQVGQKVVVVDADMRKGHLHRYFEHDGRNGLSDYLSGQADAEQVINETKVENLHFVPRGQVPPNPSELLMHPRFQAFMEELSSRYDLVLVDTPPVLAVTDAAIIGQLAGTSLMVARYAVNSVKEVDVSIRRFDQNRVDIKGVIFNCIERRASTEYYGYYNYRYESDKG